MTRFSFVISMVFCLALCGCEGDQIGESVPDPEIISENNRGVGLMGQFKYSEAYDVFDELIKRSPGNHEIRINHAIAQLNRQNQDDEAKALANLQQILQEDPSNLRASFVAGILHTYTGDIDKAAAQFSRVVEADPMDAYAAYYLGQALSQMDKPEEAMEWYERAISLDPYLRSTYYGAAQSSRRLGRGEDASRYLEEFQAMADNPRSMLAEIKYTRMGPKAEVAVIGSTSAPAPLDSSRIWASEPSLLMTQAGWTSDDLPGLTACDINMDGRVDLFCNGIRQGDSKGRSMVLWNRESGWVADQEMVLAGVNGIMAALWGDVDGNGWPDVFLCRNGENQLWMQDDGQWARESAVNKLGLEPAYTIDGALFDADHDGDLDVYAVNADGPNVLLNNNRDGTWRIVGEQEGLPSPDRESREVIVADLDNDRDLDLIIINEEAPHEVYVNDRLWRYRPAEGFDAFINASIAAAVAGDVDADGHVELVTVSEGMNIKVWSRSDGWSGQQIAKPLDDFEGKAEQGGLLHQSRPQLALIDVTGSGQLSLLRSQWDSVIVSAIDVQASTATHQSRLNASGLRSWAPVLLDKSNGSSVVSLSIETEDDAGTLKIMEHGPGAGRYEFVTVSFTGKHDEGQSMRSNASGIGTRFAARSGAQWTLGRVLRDDSGPGQSLQPMAIGLAGKPSLDFLAIEWSDGVYQTELGVVDHVTIEETQRQLASCPVLFVRNGDSQQFVSDLLGVGGIGFRTGRDTVVEPRPWEKFIFPEDVLRPYGGHYELVIAEPMEESCYLDAAFLTCWHLPPGWSMTLDERMGTGLPKPPGKPVFFRESIHPTEAWNNAEGDVTSSLLAVDGIAAEPTPRDVRFLGRLETPHVMEISFGQPLTELEGSPVLVLDGWVEYPYSQTCFAAWQASASYDPPTIEARVGEGSWQVIAEKVGYPAGMPRQMSIPLNRLPAGTDQLRISTNLEIYWDQVMVVGAEECEQAVAASLPLVEADLFQPGFPVRKNGPQQRPGFDWNERVPLWDTRHQWGFHTRMGDVMSLIAEKDGALAIFGPGEAIAFRFDELNHPLPEGWTSRLVLEVEGWAKDQDMFTRDGVTIEPLPVEAVGAARDLHESHNTRWMGGH